ncbi:hypothetical protein [Flavobacterium sp. HNIBRBA15423]|uniref:hypothetical protein n=1 Tax=Flavobacterium sp. HNIBRBA15423 TaxID=3458683 RepID=UPI004044207E
MSDHMIPQFKIILSEIFTDLIPQSDILTLNNTVINDLNGNFIENFNFQHFYASLAYEGLHNTSSYLSNIANNLLNQQNTLNIINMRKVHQKVVNKTQLFLAFIFILIYSSNIYSQNVEDIKKVDTIYIYIDKTNKKIRRYPDANRHKSVFFKNYITYEFNPNKINTIFFVSNTYKDFDDVEKGIITDERIEKKSFLKKNKDVILDVDFFEKNGFKNTFNLLYKKTIYLIDKDEIKGRKIKVKQVRMSCFDCFEE